MWLSHIYKVCILYIVLYFVLCAKCIYFKSCVNASFLTRYTYSQHTEKMNSKWAAEHMLYACSLCAVMSKVDWISEELFYSLHAYYIHILNVFKHFKLSAIVTSYQVGLDCDLCIFRSFSLPRRLAAFIGFRGTFSWLCLKSVNFFMNV